MTRSGSNRRDFLKASAGIAATVPYFWSSDCAKGESANDKIGVASIGTSIYTDRWGTPGKRDGQGSMIGRKAAKLGNMVAVADVNQVHAEAFAKPYQGRCKTYQDYRRVLDRKDVEAVTIGTPDHWHVKIAVDAMAAGKDVYCEKPLTLTIGEGKQVCDAARRTGRVLQVGTQQRSEYGSIFLTAVAIARSGRLGDKLHALSSVGEAEVGGPFENCDPPKQLDWDFWLGQTPKVGYCTQRCNYDFRWWLEYSGGQVTDWGVHHTDIAVWALGGEKTGPVEAEGTGRFPQGREKTAAMLFNGEKPPNGYNVATKFDARIGLANGNTINLTSGPNELIISGEKGRIRVNRGGLTGKPVEELTEKDRNEINEEIVKLCHGHQPGNHMKNFFECIKDRSLPISDVYSHVNSVNSCHMANIAMLLGRKVKWDPEKYDFIDDAQASSLVNRKQRAEYAI